MKRILLNALLFASCSAMAQTTDMVSLGSGYAKESFYSFANGEVANVDNNNWHLSFDLSAFGATVRLNRKQVELYDAATDAADWMNTLDTTGMFGVWDQYINGYEWWSEGALNNAATQGDPFDMGWGEYNTTTHQVNGSRVFVLKFNDGTCKKLLIENLGGGTYTFKHADLDGGNEVAQSVVKGDYTNRNFVYYDVLSDQVIDREPANDSWDVVFTNYVLELAPGYYSGVTGALHNNGVTVSEVSGVPVATATYNTWDTMINVIGYDWKSFNMSTFSYDIVADLCYFVQTEQGDVWKLIFTDFEGSSNGNIHFTKEQVEYAGIPVHEGANLMIYPNPANNEIHIEYAHDVAKVRMMNMRGQEVLTTTSGMKLINVSALEEGIYFVEVSDSEGRKAVKRVAVRH